MQSVKVELIAGAICIALGAVLAWYITDSHWNNKWSARDVADQKAQAAQAIANVNKLHADETQIADIDQQHQQQIQEIQSNADATIASYRAGSLKLRQQFTCTGRAVSEATTAASVRDAATRCGLQQADVEFLVQFAQRADTVAAELADAQKVIRVYYKSINGEDLK